MDHKLKAKWVKALRSGKYKQAHNNLKDGKSLCCIGVGYVACKGRRPSFSATQHASTALGLRPIDAKYLIDLNDMHNKTFDEIANWIEGNL